MILQGEGPPLERGPGDPGAPRRGSRTGRERRRLGAIFECARRRTESAGVRSRLPGLSRPGLRTARPAHRRAPARSARMTSRDGMAIARRSRSRPFMDDEFLLESRVASDLYHQFAAPLPIIDFHSHLDPEHLATDHRYRSITEIWLDGDHYKWRAMRANGVAERCITGNASDWERFDAWARTAPDTLRNPLYHWSHLELQRAFESTPGCRPPRAARFSTDATSGCARTGSRYSACSASFESPSSARQTIQPIRWNGIAGSRPAPSARPACIRRGGRTDPGRRGSRGIQRVDRQARGGVSASRRRASLLPPRGAAGAA